MAQLDLNLLVALDALLSEGSVTAAADRLDLSVPAMSRTLKRIRIALDDPILVRAGRGMVPTPRAIALRDRLHQLVEEAHALVETGRDLDLASLDRGYTIRANDALISLLAARLVERVRVAAPGVHLRFMPEGLEDLAPLRDGLIEIDVGVIGDLGPEFRIDPLYDEHLVVMVAGSHPLGSTRVTLRRLATIPYVAVSRLGRRRGAFDDALEAHGLHRSVVAVVPTFTSAAHIVLSSGLAGLFPAQYARHVAALTGAQLFPIDADLPPLALSQAWHVRHDTDPAHQWLRGQLHEVACER